MGKSTAEEFIKKAKLKHGDKYDYSLVEYKNSLTKVKIKFNNIIYLQRPDLHINGRSPEKLNVKKTTKQFIEESIMIHGDKYDYSLTEYDGIMKKVKIIFGNKIYNQSANDHLNGHCPENIHHTTDTQHFIDKAKLIHGEKYDYSKVDYKNQKTKVIIIYNGKEYKQRPSQHIQGFKPELINSLSQEEFIDRCNEVHNDKYDYSLIKYTNMMKKIKIIYKGKIYEQVANDHICGYSPMELMPKSKGEEKIEHTLKKYNINFEPQYSYNDCKHKNKLRFDFFLPEYNILIEYDGMQHFCPIKHFGGEKTYKYTLLRDNIKNKFALKNKIPLLRISYLEGHLTENIILDFIKNHNISNSDKSCF